MGITPGTGGARLKTSLISAGTSSPHIHCRPVSLSQRVAAIPGRLPAIHGAEAFIPGLRGVRTQQPGRLSTFSGTYPQSYPHSAVDCGKAADPPALDSLPAQPGPDVGDMLVVMLPGVAGPEVGVGEVRVLLDRDDDPLVGGVHLLAGLVERP